VFSHQRFSIEIDYELITECCGLRIAVTLYSAQGDALLTSGDVDTPESYKTWVNRPVGRYQTCCYFPPNLLNEGKFSLGIRVGIPDGIEFFHDERAFTFTVDSSSGIGSHWPPTAMAGFFRPKLQWEIRCHCD
jgi:hypothetical protein